MNLIVGMKEDTQIRSIASDASYTKDLFYWDDYKTCWYLYAVNSGIHIYDIVLSRDIDVLSEYSKVYVRQANSQDEELINAFWLLHSTDRKDGLYIYSPPIRHNSNKLSQLKYFKEMAPKTLVVKSLKNFRGESNKWVGKSISNVRSKVDYLPNLRRTFDSPALLQRKVSGAEYKVHAIRKRDKIIYFNFRIDKKHSTQEVDYRYANNPYRVVLVQKIPDSIKRIARKIMEETYTNFIDIDYLECCGKITVLEWNNGPVSSFYEAKSGVIFGSTNRYLFADLVSVAIVSKKGVEPIVGESNVLELCIDDFNEGWFVEFNEAGLLFNANGRFYIPSKIYISNEIPYNRFSEELFSLLEYYSPNAIGLESRSFRNSSKPLQLIKTKKSLSDRSQIKFPYTRILKMHKDQTQDLKGMIVKSISGTRSVVVNSLTFSEWDISAIKNTPVQFQEEIAGLNIRVHIVGRSELHAVSASSVNTDYRYDRTTNFEKEVLSKELKNEVLLISKAECNDLVGIDLIRKECSGSEYFLECNPHPDWLYFEANSDGCDGEIGGYIRRYLKTDGSAPLADYDSFSHS